MLESIVVTDVRTRFCLVDLASSYNRVGFGAGTGSWWTEGLLKE